ncbi:hypothetical protein HaLaN_12562 [Haematococcus lacustris]|uniref:Uncharacterized protein n=1 Tax=Haematococcus lacustris TaxID=44745 RepID=A0A699Z0Z5_HAELA|nr:hypothetical protein HaLaN_12562 [Haematococcus lacustris]
MQRLYISPTQSDWPDYLSVAQFVVNYSWQDSINPTPSLEAVAKTKQCMHAAQQRQAAYANQDRREVQKGQEVPGAVGRLRWRKQNRPNQTRQSLLLPFNGQPSLFGCKNMCTWNE